MLSNRAKNLIAKPSPILLAHTRCAGDPFHSETNPDGYINLGTAENYLVWDLLEKKLRESRGLREADIHYGPPHGALHFREQVAALVNRKFGASLTSEDLVLAVGATSILDMLAFSLCEPGEGILIPSPFYPGFVTDLGGRAEAVALPAPLTSANNFSLSDESLETGYERARKRGIRVKALLVCSPSNPLGRVLTIEELEGALAFIARHRIQGIFDEIYACSVYGKGPFHSILKLRARHPKLSDSLHFVYGLSKDFTLSGLRVGIYHSTNAAVMQAMQGLSYFHGIPGDTQRMLSTLLADGEWVDHFIDENQRRLGAAFRYLGAELGRQTRAKVLEAQAGVFAWLDLRHAMTSPDFESERALCERLLAEAKVNLLPGAAFQSQEPGWFRLCFAQSKVTLAAAAGRLSRIL